METAPQTFTAADESLLYAFSALLSHLNVQVDLATLRQGLAGQDLNYESLVEGELVHIVTQGDGGTWPSSNDAIVRFQFQDLDEPYIDVDGVRQQNLVDHYCIVADYQKRTILDSADGVIREPNQYGQPVSWAMFAAGSAPAEEPAAPLDETRNYTVLSGGESLWQIARKFQIDANILKEHNDLEDIDLIPAGTVLHLPIPQAQTAKQGGPTFEILRRPLQMHVSKEGGTRKYSFGNAASWDDISPTGPTYPENQNVNICAIAHVPVGDETAAYYMESNEFDVSTKKVRWTIGFNHSHLAEGHVEKTAKPAPQVKEIIQAKLDEAAERRKVVENAAKNAEIRKQMIIDVNAEDNPPSKRMGSDSIPVADDDLNTWKGTYEPLNEDRTPEVFLFDEDLIIQDLDGRCKNKFVRRLEGVKIGGWFTGPDDKPYYRPQDAVDSFTWYGIPTDKVMSEAELYNYRLPLAERASMRHGRLSLVERYFTVPLARATAKNNLLRRYSEKIKQQRS